LPGARFFSLELITRRLSLPGNSQASSPSPSISFSDMVQAVLFRRNSRVPAGTKHFCVAQADHISACFKVSRSSPVPPFYFPFEATQLAIVIAGFALLSDVVLRQRAVFPLFQSFLSAAPWAVRSETPLPPRFFPLPRGLACKPSFIRVVTRAAFGNDLTLSSFPSNFKYLPRETEHLCFLSPAGVTFQMSSSLQVR